MDGSSGPEQFESVIIGGDPVPAHSDEVDLG